MELYRHGEIQRTEAFNVICSFGKGTGKVSRFFEEVEQRLPWETFWSGIVLRWLIGFSGANSVLPLLALYAINENSAHLRRFLEMRTPARSETELMSYVLLGSVQDEEDEPTAFCALTWSGSSGVPSGICVLVKEYWKTILTPETAFYFGDLTDTVAVAVVIAVIFHCFFLCLAWGAFFSFTPERSEGKNVPTGKRSR